MQMLTAPININYTAQYITTQISTALAGHIDTSFAGAWSGCSANGGVKFILILLHLSAGASYTYTFPNKKYLRVRLMFGRL